MDQLNPNEIIETAIRKNVKVYPEIAIREFVANALIHQNFMVSGTGVMIEIFTDRIENLSQNDIGDFSQMYKRGNV
jgi:ATP-dependent DNA helicase RecG